MLGVYSNRNVTSNKIATGSKKKLKFANMSSSHTNLSRYHTNISSSHTNISSSHQTKINSSFKRFKTTTTTHSSFKSSDDATITTKPSGSNSSVRRIQSSPVIPKVSAYNCHLSLKQVIRVIPQHVATPLVARERQSSAHATMSSQCTKEEIEMKRREAIRKRKVAYQSQMYR